MNELAQVNRFELIDHTKHGEGREFVKWEGNEKFQVSYSIQDDGRTLKVFLTEEVGAVKSGMESTVESEAGVRIT